MTIVGLFSLLTFVQLLHLPRQVFLTFTHRKKRKIPFPDPSPNPNCNTTPQPFDYNALLTTAVQIRYF